jgi:hypothetical protein
MTADLHGGVAGGLTKVAGVGGSDKSGGVPFSITGTTSDPKFVPNMAGVAGSVAQGALGNAMTGKKGATDATGAIGGLLGRKKPK